MTGLRTSTRETMMPLSNVRYRVTKTRKGDKIRLAFSQASGNVVEAVNLKTGKTHSPAEFAADRKKKKKRGLKEMMTGQ